MLGNASTWQWHWRLAVEFEGFTNDEESEVLSELNRAVGPHRFLVKELMGNCDTSFTISKVNSLQPYGPGDAPSREPPEVGFIVLPSRGPNAREATLELHRIQREVQIAVNSWWTRRSLDPS